MKVDIEDVREHLRYRSKINSVDIHDIEWYENGKRLVIPKDILDEFSRKWVGFNNIAFISMGLDMKKLDDIL